MMIVAHPDDDQLYLGAVIPTYTQQGKSVVTVFMTYSNSKRKQEALNGLYTEGERIYPVFDSLRDDLVNGKWITTMDQARKQWSDSDPLEFLTEQVRKYKPTVIVSMDVNNGEYRHGAHIYTAYLAQQVFAVSADRDAYPESYSEYGTWQPAKLYLHLFKENKLTIDTGVPLSIFGGKTALQMAKLGYKCHKSQQKWRFAVSTTRYSICDFGLALSKVGYENTSNDMFENIGPDTMDQLNP
jgi:LmbE family N-acetylglucosaminyl deacetylase